jgi:hypothetical protein
MTLGLERQWSEREPIVPTVVALEVFGTVIEPEFVKELLHDAAGRKSTESLGESV